MDSDITTTPTARLPTLAPTTDDRPDFADVDGVRSPADGDRGLVLLDPDHPERTVRGALRDPATLAGVLTLLFVYPTAEYEARRRARAAAGVPGEYTIGHLETAAELRARTVGRDWLSAAGHEYAARGAVGRVRDCVVGAVVAEGYTRVYVDDVRPRWWQRLLGAESLAATLERSLPPEVAVLPVTDAGAVSASGHLEDAASGVGR